MFCPNCGKQIKDSDNFCRYCGADVRNTEIKDISENDNEYVVHRYDSDESQISKTINEYKLPDDDAEELVLYDIKKHWMALFWPVILTPVFFIYFWIIFLNTHSLFSWIIVLILLFAIIYPILRYNSDKIIITTKYAHIKLGVLNPVEIDIPLTKIDVLDVSQTTVGRMFDYGTVSFVHDSERYEYGYVQSPGELQYIIDDPARFVHEAMTE